MRPARLFRLAALMALVPALMPAAASAALRAGAASVDITPPVGTPMFAYTARSGIANPSLLPDVAMQLVGDPGSGHYAKTFVASRGIHMRLRARAIALEEGGVRYALAQADLGGLPYALYQDVLRRIADTGIDARRLLLSATHTHAATGPIWPSDSAGYALLGGDLLDPRVYELTAAGIAQAIRQAVAGLRPARAGIGEARVTNASHNRDFEPFTRNKDVPKDPAAARRASIDPVVTVIRFDTRSGSPLAVWSNFAVHPTSYGAGNLLFSGDNAGVATRVAEAEIARAARTRRAVVDVWTNANEGDIAPDGSPDRLTAGAVQYSDGAAGAAVMAGRRVGRGIARAWRSAGRAMRGSLAIDARRSLLSFDGTTTAGEPVGPVPVLGAGGIVAGDGTCAPVSGFAGPGQGRKFPAIAGPGLAPSLASVSAWRIGDLLIAGFPSELTRQMGLRVRRALLARAAGTGISRAVIAGLTNGYVSYTTTPEEYDACHYEGSFTLYGRQQGPRYQAFALGLTSALLRGEPAPAGASEPAPFPLGLGGNGPRVTPDAGSVVREPAATVARRGQATFSWHGGDPAVDAPHGQPLVTLERRVRGGWLTVGSDDGFADATELASSGVWTERWQFDTCDALGSYRFVVTGRADRGSGPAGYRVVSHSFLLTPLRTLKAASPVVDGGRARVVVSYPDPGPQALLPLSRLARSGAVLLRSSRAGDRAIVARPDASGAFSARVPRGRTVTVADVRDGCGNNGVPG
jgi:neutral ceramidase